MRAEDQAAAGNLAMRTYPSVDEKSGLTVAFEIENGYVSPSTVARILSSVPGINDVRARRLFEKSDDIRVWFKHLGIPCVVREPFGDNTCMSS